MAPPFLAVPIKARISVDGVLLSADPPIWRLHFLAGGMAEGMVAVPGLADLAAKAARTKMRVEGPVRAADEENDVELWAEASFTDENVELVITGWRKVWVQDSNVGNNEIIQPSTEPDEHADALMVDPQLRIVRWPITMQACVHREVIGCHLGEIFVFNGNRDGSIPIVDMLVERREIEGEIVRLAGAESVCTVNLRPLFDGNGMFLGHGGTLRPLEVERSSAADDQRVPDLPMGRQFATVLKQPLSRIVANAETIGNRLFGPLRDNYADYAQDIANAARHLSELVSDMEDLEAIDRADFSVERDNIELGDIANRVAGLLSLKAADHGITIRLPEQRKKIEAIGEFRRVLQIVLNLVGNAIRYAPDGSTIHIEIAEQNDRACITVADEGKGIDPENRERVFEKFERLGRSGDGGSGLGLYISRRLARAMNGDLQVESAPGGGALFRLQLPAA